MDDSASITCAPAFRWGARWCDTHDRRLGRCELDAACAPVAPEHEGIELTTAGRAVWVACPCGVEGPHRSGDAETAWAMALLDRAAHLAGEDLDAITARPELDPPVEPTPNQELLTA
jgi:hypothetical protein